MPVRGRLLSILALAALLTACGGASAGPQTASVEPPPPPTGANAVTVSPFDAGTDATTGNGSAVKPAFPAATPSGVLALAAQHPNGRVTYATLLDGSQGEMTLARQGEKGLVAITRDTGTVRVGVNLGDSSIAWVCVTKGAEAPTCKRRDFDHHGADALATAALLIGEDRLRQIAARISSTADAGLEVQTRANRIDASCLTGTDASEGNLMVCVSPSGFVTDTEEGSTIARAAQVSPDVSPQELTPAGLG
ncbi:MAG: hypothetical protein ACR2JV_04520 [Gaiellales bacterium]